MLWPTLSSAVCAVSSALRPMLSPMFVMSGLCVDERAAAGARCGVLDLEQRADELFDEAPVRGRECREAPVAAQELGRRAAQLLAQGREAGLRAAALEDARERERLG